MKTWFLITSSILWLTLAAIPLWARLGETVEECDARYGTPKEIDKEKDGTPTRAYQYGDFQVRVIFLEGKSVYEEFKKDNKLPLTAEEAQRILEVNKQGSDWAYHDDSDDATPESWLRVDGMAKAWTIGKPKSIIVASKDYRDQKSQEYDEAQKQKQLAEEKLLLGL